MQLMPQTAQQFGDNPLDPMQNVDAGTRYLRALLDHYSSYHNCLARDHRCLQRRPHRRGPLPRHSPLQGNAGYVVRVLFYMRFYEASTS